MNRPSPLRSFLGPDRPHRRTLRGPVRLWVWAALAALAFCGCAKYNTFFNAKRAFDNAEQVRTDALRKHQDPPPPAGTQKTDYEMAIAKAQKLLDEYPGHGLTDDALFLQAKAYHRLESYRMSIRKFDLLFTNFPATDFLEESLYLQALNYLLIGSLERSQDYLDNLARQFPRSGFQAETRKVSGDNFFALEDYAGAAESYRLYLAQQEGVQDADRVGLKLATCHWELGQFEQAAQALEHVVETTASPEITFQARLLEARVRVRLGEHQRAAELLDGLRAEAQVYNSQGMLALVEAENLFAQGRGQDATPLLENMPQEWQTPAVKAMAADLLGYEFMARGEWEPAKTQFQEALRRKDDLEDAQKTRRLNDNLNDYLAAQTALKDAQGARVASLNLLQANALLFGLDRPRRAAEFYLQAAADTAADSTVAARALFGASLAYRQYLANEDSAAICGALLQARYPQSPQAFAARRTQDDPTLLGYLLDIRSQEQRERLAGLSDQERRDLETTLGSAPGAGGGRTPAGPGVRRRMIYLARRSNILFPPLESAHGAPGRPGTPGFGPPGQDLTGTAPPPEVSPQEAGQTPQGQGMDGAVQNDGAAAGQAQDKQPAQEQPTEEQPAEDQQTEEQKKKKKQDENWDILRSPRPAAEPGP